MILVNRREMAGLFSHLKNVYIEQAIICLEGAHIITIS